MKFLLLGCPYIIAAISFAVISLLGANPSQADDRPHILLLMADDMGWGQTGYRKHPVLKTPNLDAMAANGLRFDRFYAGAATCSPTRASVLTGRSNDRTGVQDHGYALRLQEKTLPVALRDAGYVTGHFGKWHLNGLRGPGVPVLANDERNPTVFGFTQWLSVTNFFDRDPVMSRMGIWEEKKGDSSEIIIDEALQFFEKHRNDGKPLFTVVWYGSPHSPFIASDEDKAEFESLDSNSRAHYGELVAMDRSIGTLRKGLRDLNMAENTLIWFCSDNGGLPAIVPDSVGGLRGFKGTIYEGGLRVPAIVEWPSRISQPRVTAYPACTMDIFSTLAELVNLPETSMLQPQDGHSLVPLFDHEIATRSEPIHFRQRGRAALVDNRYKLLTKSLKSGEFELYDLESDPKEEIDIAAKMPERFEAMKAALLAWNESVIASVEGQDYPEGKVNEGHPEPRQWSALDEYKVFVEQHESSIKVKKE